MTELDQTKIDQAVAVLKKIESDINTTVDQLRAAGFSETEQPPAEQ